MNVLDTNIVFAIRCSDCGIIKFHSISIFNLPLNQKVNMYCDCGSNEMSVTLKENKTLVIDIPCIACDTNHTYIYNLKDVLKRQVKIICCNDTGLELCFMGREKYVTDIVTKYQNDINLLFGELGFLDGIVKDLIKEKTKNK